MKKLSILFSILLLVGCEIESNSSPKYGTFFRLNNNTFGVNDFRIADSGYFAIAYGALDFGRNFYRNHETYPDFQDSIGYVYFDGKGNGLIEYVNQDTIHQRIDFTYVWGKSDRNYQYLNIQFGDATVRTWSRTEPLNAFGYEKIGKYWRYKAPMHQYSGEWSWAGNLLKSDVVE